MKYHVVALPLTEIFYRQIIGLNEQFIAGEKQPLAGQAGKLMSEISCQIIDDVFGTLVKKFASNPDLSVTKQQVFNESLQQIEDVKGVMRKYMGWALSWFGNERLTPVVNYFVGLIQQKNDTEQTQYFLIFKLPQDIAERALLALYGLEDGKVASAEGAVESLIEVTDIGVTQLIRKPKALLKFNIVTDKTLNGVIKVTTAMAYKNLRKFAQHLDPVLYSVFSQHLAQFLKVEQLT